MPAQDLRIPLLQFLILQNHSTCKASRSLSYIPNLTRQLPTSTHILQYLFNFVLMCHKHTSQETRPSFFPLCNQTADKQDQLGLILYSHGAKCLMCECIQFETVLNGFHSLAVWYIFTAFYLLWLCVRYKPYQYLLCCL